MRSSWDTAIVAPRDGLEYWRDAVSQAFLPLEPETRLDCAFSGTIEMLKVPRIAVSRVHSLESVVRRTGSGIARRQDGSYFANLVLSGAGTVRQFGRSATVRPGGIILVDTNEPFDLDFTAQLDVVCVTLGAESFRRFLPRDGRLAASAIAPRGAGRLAAAYMSALAADLDDLGGADDLAADQISSLLARAIAESAGSAEPSDPGSALLRRIEQLIAAEIANPDLGAKRICSALGIARSTLFATLARDGRSLSGCIRDLRLQRCRAELTDPGLAHLAIREIATRWGFRDPTSFSRSFRRATGMTPQAWRATR